MQSCAEVLPKVPRSHFCHSLQGGNSLEIVRPDLFVLQIEERSHVFLLPVPPVIDRGGSGMVMPFQLLRLRRFEPFGHLTEFRCDRFDEVFRQLFPTATRTEPI